MTDKEFWIAIRAALLALVSAIEIKHMQKRYKHIPLNGDRDAMPAEYAGVVRYGE